MTISNTTHQTIKPPVHLVKEKIRSRLAIGKEVIDLSQAMVNLLPSQEVINSIELSDSSLYRMTSILGLDALREEIASYRSDVFSEPISKENVLVTAGANQGFIDIALALVDPGDDIMLLEPYFFNHHMIATLRGANPIVAELNTKAGFQVDHDELARHWTPSTGMLVVTDPNNPTGTVLTDASLQVVQDHTGDRDAWLVIDETYIDFDYTSKVAFRSHRFALENTILLGSFSKSLALASWRIGYIIASTELVSDFALLKAQDVSIIAPPTPSQQMVLAILPHRERYFQQVMPQYNKRRLILKDRLQRMDAFEDVHGEAGVFVFAKLADGIDGKEFVAKLIDQTGVAALDGSPSGRAGEGHVRFAYGMVSEEVISRACDLIEGFVESRAWV